MPPLCRNCSSPSSAVPAVVLIAAAIIAGDAPHIVVGILERQNCIIVRIAIAAGGDQRRGRSPRRSAGGLIRIVPAEKYTAVLPVGGAAVPAQAVIVVHSLGSVAQCRADKLTVRAAVLVRRRPHREVSGPVNAL